MSDKDKFSAQIRELKELPVGRSSRKKVEKKTKNQEADQKRPKKMTILEEIGEILNCIMKAREKPSKTPLDWLFFNNYLLVLVLV